MRINKYIAQATGLGRRGADIELSKGSVTVNGKPAQNGYQVKDTDKVYLNNHLLRLPDTALTIILNKPVGYVCSREGQGNKTIYDLLPENLHHLKPVGRLDKDSSGLLLMTNDGELAHTLTHPKFQKTKVYEVALDQPLAPEHFEQITGEGVDIGDKTSSRLQLKKLENNSKKIIPNSYFLVTMQEGRNRQIRRTFNKLGYNVTKLHRTHLGPYRLDNLATGAWKNS